MQEEKVPQRVEGIDITHLSIGPQEGFVYSRVDGVLNLHDLADLTGVSLDDVSASLHRLVEAGAVCWLKVDSDPPPHGHSDNELLEDVDIEPEVRIRIVEKFGRLGLATHYELLGVSQEATRAEIRKAYFKLSKEFHPDSFYGKNLGSFQNKMERIFKGLTDAYEALSKSSKRKKYDAYLDKRNAATQAERKLARGVARAEAMERAISDPPKTAPSAPAGVSINGSASKGEVSRGSSSQDNLATDSSEAQRPYSSQTMSATRPGAATTTRPRRRPATAAERLQRKRALLEQRLGRGAKRPVSKSNPRVQSPKPAPTPATTAAAPADRRDVLRDLTKSLKRSASLTGGADRLKRHISDARQHEMDNDFAAAATALRMALVIDPNHPGLKADYHRVSEALQRRLRRMHVEQATYEEENRLWAAAAISWAKATEGDKKDANAPRRAAMALLKAGGDLKTAKEFAQKSVSRDKDSTENRLVLAQVYLAAEMNESARKELERAAKLDPSNEMVKNLLKKM